MSRRPANEAAIRGNSAGAFRPPRQPRWRHVRGVGFEDDGLQRQGRGQATNTRRAGVGHGAAKTEFEAQLDELVRLLATAVEGMRDAAPDPDPAELLEHPIDSTANVQEHRKIACSGDLQLFNEKVLLPVDRRIGDEQVEANLADGDRPIRSGDTLLQPLLAGAANRRRWPG
jgi:hypothetical protein